MIESIVTKTVKFDLHIHSAASIGKDGKKVLNNTIDNLPVLYERLSKVEVEMISITDHNIFDLVLFKRILDDVKERKTGSLRKCLPGIEFDVEIDNKRIHVISIFDDADFVKISKIQNVLADYTFDNDSSNAFKVLTFQNILTRIDINVLLIAHQKSDVRAKIHNDNLSNIGQVLFDNIISIDYFDAVEFRSGKVEGMLKTYREEHSLENLRFITGTDCHVWSEYPRQDANCNQDIKFSYMKSLCTYKGLVMALTEPRRISTANFSISSPYIKSFHLNINSKKSDIYLSPGINVIIGDNSIGKSLILEKLFNAKYNQTSNNVLVGHDKYLKRKSIKIDKILNLAEISILYRGQGGIRKDFQKSANLKDIDFFKNKFKPINYTKTIEKIRKYVNLTLELLNQNQRKQNVIKSLNYVLNIPADVEESHYFLKTISDLKNDSTNYSVILSSFELIKSEMDKLSKNPLFIHGSELEESLIKIIIIEEFYKKTQDEININNRAIIIINNEAILYNKKYVKKQLEQEKQVQTFRENQIATQDIVINAIKVMIEKQIDPIESYVDIVINPTVSVSGEYKFIVKNEVEQIDKKRIEEILTFPIKNIKTLAGLSRLCEDNLLEKIKITESCKFNNEKLTAIELYQRIIERYCNEIIFNQDMYINKNDTKLVTGNSPGKNALIFLDVLSNEKIHQVIVIDQPGDDVSQNRVSSDLIYIFRKMADSGKQVIIVTHKAELVVNLDVDNVIILKENENDEIEIYHGALEFEDESINVLDNVAEFLDGGVETIRRRWKRYDKKTN